MNRAHQLPPGSVRTPGLRRRGIRLGTVLLVVLAASCGGDDDADESVTNDATAASVTVATEPADESADADAVSTPSVDDVANCLADAGWETTGNDELLTPQQQTDLETVFGQVDGLTFTGVAFAGSISFFQTPDQATERAKQLSETAVVLVPVGPVLISVGAGSEYEDAIAAAESCLA